jgi:hypothetical protein
MNPDPCSQKKDGWTFAAGNNKRKLGPIVTSLPSNMSLDTVTVVQNCRKSGHNSSKAKKL